MIPADRIAAEPLRTLLRDRSVGPSEIAERLGVRSNRTLMAWRRWFDRLAGAATVSYRIADEVCVALGVHLSHVDALYWQEPLFDVDVRGLYREEAQAAWTYVRSRVWRESAADPLDEGFKRLFMIMSPERGPASHHSDRPQTSATAPAGLLSPIRREAV